jgi:NADPH2:quinone reductase
MLHPPMGELLDLVAAGALKAVAGGVYPLSDAKQAHIDIRSRSTVGKLVLDPTR